MTVINADTKIGSVLKQHQQALDAIVSVSKKFEKLRNPVLRKVMAGRTSISAAAKLGGCSVEDIFEKLEPLGFTVQRSFGTAVSEPKPVPGSMQGLQPQQIKTVDVRPVISAGSDPLNLILAEIKKLSPGEALKVINTFEPTPLMLLLEKKGFENYVKEVDTDCFETIFFKRKIVAEKPLQTGEPQQDWHFLMEKFSQKCVQLEVRHLEMPGPMHAILQALDNLPDENALNVTHKRIPVFLLPELAERGFAYRIKEVTEGEVHLLIFKI